jgi:hypothetical protein
MKKLILIPLLLITAVLSAQKLSNVSSKEEAIKASTELVNATNGLKFEASQLFTEENKLAVKFSNNDSYVLVIFNDLKDHFSFTSATGLYDDILPIWNRLSGNSKEKFLDKETNTLYYFWEDNDDKWIITKQTLK